MDGSPEATAPLQDGQADRVGYPAGPESRYASDSESGGAPLSPESQVVSGIVFITVPTIAFGGTALLGFIRSRQPGYLDNPVRQALFRAGHAHAGVLVILALVGMLYVDHAALSGAVKMIVRVSLAAAPILVSAGFFLSILPLKATAPGPLLSLVYVGALCLAVGTIALGVGLLL
jgi:hypothetical protein